MSTGELRRVIRNHSVDWVTNSLMSLSPTYIVLGSEKSVAASIRHARVEYALHIRKETVVIEASYFK